MTAAYPSKFGGEAQGTRQSSSGLAPESTAAQTVERGFLIGGRLHIPRETVTLSGEPGYGGTSLSLCGKFEGIVYSVELARFHYPNLPVCLWCEGRAARGT